MNYKDKAITKLKELEADQKDLAKLEDELHGNSKYKQLMALKDKVQAAEATIRQELLVSMQAEGVDKVKTDLYNITLVKRNSFKAKEVPQEFSKVSLDTTKVNKYFKLYGEVPEGIDMTTTEYLTIRGTK